jgi:glycosyltransferase involved in cell wall biosynthesis
VLISAKEYMNVTAVAARILSLTDTPIIVTEHTMQSKHIADSTGSVYRAMPFLMRHAYGRAEAIVAVSQGIAGDLEDAFDISSDNVRVIYNPVITKDFHRRMFETISDPWLASERPLLLAVGRLDPAKDYTTLLKAFDVVRANSSARLMILGDGTLRGELERLIVELELSEDVRLRGFVANPLPYMRLADGLVLSSRFEGLPTVLIEALACSCPVVSTDCSPGVSEILDEGQFGQLVPVGDSDSLARAILKMLEGKPSPVPSKVLKRYTLEAAGGAYDDVINQVTGA